MDINPLSDVSANMFSHSVGCLGLSFYFVGDLLCCAKPFYFDEVPFVYFLLVFLPGETYLIKKYLRAMSEILLPMFSSRIFMVWV